MPRPGGRPFISETEVGDPGDPDDVRRARTVTKQKAMSLIEFGLLPPGRVFCLFLHQRGARASRRDREVIFLTAKPTTWLQELQPYPESARFLLGCASGRSMQGRRQEDAKIQIWVAASTSLARGQLCDGLGNTGVDRASHFW